MLQAEEEPDMPSECYRDADEDVVDGADTFSKAPAFVHASAGYDPIEAAAFAAPADGDFQYVTDEEDDCNEHGSNDDGQPAYWVQDNPLSFEVRI